MQWECAGDAPIPLYHILTLLRSAITRNSLIKVSRLQRRYIGANRYSSLQKMIRILLQVRRQDRYLGNIVVSKKQTPVNPSAITSEVLIPEVAASRLTDRTRG